MKVRDLEGWPPKWRGTSGVADSVVNGEVGTLTAVRWDPGNQSLALTMEREGERQSGVLKGDVGLLTKLYLLLGWQLGRALARVGSLEMTP